MIESFVSFGGKSEENIMLNSDLHILSWLLQ